MTPEEGEGEQSHSRAVRDQQRVRQPVFRQPDPSKGLFTLRLLFSFDTICFWDCAWNVVNNMNMTSTYVKRVLAALFNLKAIFKGNWKNYRDCWIISHPRLKRKTWHSHFVVGIKNIAPSGGCGWNGRWGSLVYADLYQGQRAKPWSSKCTASSTDCLWPLAWSVTQGEASVIYLSHVPLMVGQGRLKAGTSLGALALTCTGRGT